MLEGMAEVTDELADGPADSQERPATPTQVVERFLDLLQRNDIAGAMELVAVDVEYENVGLPTVHGRERMRRLFEALVRPAGAGFEAIVHKISTDGQTVLTERTDILKLRRLHVQLWVCGRFDVRDGEIVLWRDYFDRTTVIAATVRGLLGAAFPAVRAARPSAA